MGMSSGAVAQHGLCVPGAVVGEWPHVLAHVHLQACTITPFRADYPPRHFNMKYVILQSLPFATKPMQLKETNLQL